MPRAHSEALMNADKLRFVILLSILLCGWTLPAQQEAPPESTEEKQAEPDPRRASADNSCSLNCSAAAAVAARVSAAKPEADEASPAPLGKLLREATRARAVSPASARTRSR